MNLIMPCTQAHLSLGEEVTAMDDASYDVDVDVYGMSINITSDLRERMSDHE
jgi:hypothetical protein